MDGDGEHTGTTHANLPVPVERPPADVARVAAEVVRAVFGVTALATEILVRAVAGVVGAPAPAPGRAPTGPVVDPLDVVMGAAWTAADAGSRAVAYSVRLGRPVAQVLLEPPLLPRQLRPGTAVGAAVGAAARTWQRQRPQAVASVARLTGSMAPDTADVAVRLVDVDAVVTAALRHVDMTGLATVVVDSIDIDRVAASALDRVDMAGLVEQVLSELDLSAVVVDHVDLARVVNEALDGLDLTSLVVKRVDLATVVNDALDHIDLTRLVMDRVDIVGVAEYVIDAIDLPAIVRESSGSIATETVHGIRVQSMDADQAVSRVVDRLLLRRRTRRTQSPTPPAPTPPPALPQPEAPA